MSDDELDELRTLEVGGDLTALMLRDVARHLKRGEVMMLNGCWSDTYRDTTKPHRARPRKWYEIGRRQATTDAVYALVRVAELNESAAFSGGGTTE